MSTDPVIAVTVGLVRFGCNLTLLGQYQRWTAIDRVPLSYSFSPVTILTPTRCRGLLARIFVHVVSYKTLLFSVRFSEIFLYNP